MPVFFVVEPTLWEVGTPDLLTAFFSSITTNLEPEGWGTRFPALMNELYGGQLQGERATQARAELRTVREELSGHPPTSLVWDYHDPDASPPWGDSISSDITGLGNYFYTPDGRDLIDVMDSALADAEESGEPLKIHSAADIGQLLDVLDSTAT